MESVLDSVRSWRDLTAGLLPRVASAAQLEAKRLANCGQAVGAAELSRALRKATEKLSTRSDALLGMVEELREIATAVASAEQAGKEKMKAEKPPSLRKEKEKVSEKKKYRGDKDKDKAPRSHKRAGGPSPAAGDGNVSARPPPPPPDAPADEAHAAAHAERTARAERMSAGDAKGPTAAPPPPPPLSEESPLPADEFTAVSLEELVAAVRSAARLPASLRARDVVTQGRIILGVSDGGGTLREELVRLRKYGQLQQAPPPPPSELDDSNAQHANVGSPDKNATDAPPRPESPVTQSAAAAAAVSVDATETVEELPNEPTKGGGDAYKSSAADILESIKSVYSKAVPSAEYGSNDDHNDGGSDSWASSDDEGNGVSPTWAGDVIPDRDSSTQKEVAVDATYVADGKHDEKAPEAAKELPEDYYKDSRAKPAASTISNNSEAQEMSYQGRDDDTVSDTTGNTIHASDDPRFSSLGLDDGVEEALDWETQSLRRQERGWIFPGAAGGEWDEGKRLIGRRVFVDGYGEGIVTDYSKKTLGLIGSSTHSIDFNTPGSGESEAAQRVANLQKQKHQRDEAGRRTSGGSQSGLGSWSPSNFPGSDDDPRFASLHYEDDDLTEPGSENGVEEELAEDKECHREEEATWVDTEEADRWEQEQTDRWNGVGIRSFPDPYNDLEYLPSEPEPEPELDPEVQPEPGPDEADLIFVAKRKPPRRNRGSAAAAVAAAAAAAAEATAAAERKAAKVEEERCPICGRGGSLCRCRGASSPDSFSFPTAPVGSVSQPPRSSNQHSGSTQPSSVSSPSPSTAASTRSTGVATSGVERDRNRGRDREKRRPPERRSSRRQHHSNYVPPPPPPPPAEDDIAETNLPSPPASPSPAAVQKQEDMEAKLKARQAERLQAERMAAMRATQKEREVRAAEAEIEQRVSLWAGKKDLRSLLASLPSIWNAASVSTFPASLYSESGDSKVKKAYMQALRLVHPDKLPANTTVQDEVQATKIFTRLQAAYEVFKDAPAGSRRR